MYRPLTLSIIGIFVVIRGVSLSVPWITDFTNMLLKLICLGWRLYFYWLFLINLVKIPRRNYISYNSFVVENETKTGYYALRRDFAYFQSPSNLTPLRVKWPLITPSLCCSYFLKGCIWTLFYPLWSFLSFLYLPNEIKVVYCDAI